MSQADTSDADAFESDSDSIDERRAEDESDPLDTADGRQDLYIGLVRAVGTDLGDAVEALRICFSRAGYTEAAVHHLKLSRYLEPLLASSTGDNKPILSAPAEGRQRYYDSRMNAGDWIRTKLEPGILAQAAAVNVKVLRNNRLPSEGARPGMVFIFDSLMHKDEVAVLRSVYGKRFFLLAVHSTSAERENHLLDEFRSSDPNEAPSSLGVPSGDGSDDFEESRRFEAKEHQRRSQVIAVMKRDEGLSDPDSPYSPAPPSRRVSIRKTFALADVFVSVQEAAAARRGDQTGVLERFVQKVFDEPFHTPTRDELGMAHAYVAARRSGSLARHVGAALCTTDGDILAVGTNEVPSAMGGQYWPPYDGGSDDARDTNFAGALTVNLTSSELIPMTLSRMK